MSNPSTVYTTLIDRYKRKLNEIGIGDEVFKWKWIQDFRGRPNLDAPDLAAEVREVLNPTNLMYPLSRGVLVKFAIERPIELKSLLINLYDESVNLQSRVNAYLIDAEALYFRIRINDTRSQQDERTISALLALKYPESYPVYKDSIYRKLCNDLGIPLKPAGEKYVHYVRLVEEFIENNIRQDIELIDMVRAELPVDAYPDPNFRLLAQDILYQCYEGLASNRIVDVDPVEPRVWLMAPGSQASKWQEFRKEGYGAIDFDIHEDLSLITQLSDFDQLLGDSGTTLGPHSSRACWEFAHVMKPGDWIIAKRGRSAYIGLGIVTTDYFYETNAKEYPHRRRVNWIKEGEWKEKWQIVTKTLTDITKYPDYVRELKEKIGFGDEIIEDAIITMNPDSYEKTYEDDSNTSYWWLNANPKYWDLSEHAIGSIQTYTTHAETGNKRRIYKYFEALKPGDQIIGYETTPRKRVVARLVVTHGLHQDEEDRECIEFRVDHFYANRPTWDELQSDPTLVNAEILGSNQGSLFKLTPEEFQHIEALATGATKTIEPYTLADATKGSFLDPDWLTSTLSLWRSKKNIVLQGPPGTGKTFVAKRMAWLLMRERDESRLHMVQFHPSYSYEDFIEGYRPNGQSGFTLKSGHFLSFCRRAASDSDRPYVFVIDEINRGNLSKIFGEVMMGIEADKRGEPIHLQYGSADLAFSIPPNLFMIGTMNTADRSLALVDYALRRRFAFRTMLPEFGPRFRDFLLSKSVPPEITNRIVTALSDLNRLIQSDGSLGVGYSVGHSYFCDPPSNVQGHEAWLEAIWLYEVLPLLEEYWFDQSDQVDKAKLLLGLP